MERRHPSNCGAAALSRLPRFSRGSLSTPLSSLFLELSRYSTCSAFCALYL